MPPKVVLLMCFLFIACVALSAGQEPPPPDGEGPGGPGGKGKGGKGRHHLDKMCKSSDADLAKWEDANKKKNACRAKSDPERTKTTTTCNTEVYGSDPQTAADMKKVMCPVDMDKMKKFHMCMFKNDAKMQAYKTCMAA